MFDLPNYSKLDKKEQDPVVDFPLDKPLLVSGPPGSGKTVLGIYRLSAAIKKDITSGLLVYNQTLKQYVQSAIDDNNVKISDINSTYCWHTWFVEFFIGLTGQKPPVYNGDKFNFNWGKSIDILMPKLMTKLDKQLDQLILDEGQDFPNEFFALLRIVSKSFTIFADENQRITKNNSTIADISNSLNDLLHDKNQIKQLTKNYRNTKEIAKLASQFYCGLPTGIPTLPDRKGSKPICYTGLKESQLNIIKNECINSKNSIGIFLPVVAQLKEVVIYLRKEKIISDRIEYYHSDIFHDCPKCVNGKLNSKKHGNRRKWSCSNCKYVAYGWRELSLNYKKDSVIILTYASAKGLEFDTVIIPLVTDNPSTKNTDENRMIFYVLSSRARKKLLLMRTNEPIEILDKNNLSEYCEHKNI